MLRMGAAPSKSKDLSLRNILIFVLYSGVLIIMFVLLAKRQIKRMRLRYDTNFETRQVMGFPKHYRNGSVRQFSTSFVSICTVECRYLHLSQMTK